MGSSSLNGVLASHADQVAVSLPASCRESLVEALSVCRTGVIRVPPGTTSGLDPVARDELAGIIGDLLVDEGHSVLFSTYITSPLTSLKSPPRIEDPGRGAGSAAQSIGVDALSGSARRSGSCGGGRVVVGCDHAERAPLARRDHRRTAQPALVGGRCLAQ